MLPICYGKAQNIAIIRYTCRDCDVTIENLSDRILKVNYRRGKDCVNLKDQIESSHEGCEKWTMKSVWLLIQSVTNTNKCMIFKI